MYVFIYLSIHLPTYLPVHLPIYLSIVRFYARHMSHFLTRHSGSKQAVNINERVTPAHPQQRQNCSKADLAPPLLR